MTFSCIYNNKSVSKFSKREIQLTVFQVISVCKIKQYRAAYCTCHLIHHSGSFIPIYILCILADLCIVIISHFALIKEVIDDCTDQHFKGSRGTDTGCCNNICAYIRIKTCCLKSILLCTFHHTCNKCRCSFFVVCFAELSKIYYNLISVAFTGNTDNLCPIWVSCSYCIQINASCDYFTTVMVCMISNNLSSSWRCKIFCFVLFIGFCKIVCEFLETSTANFCFPIDFLKFCCFW